MLTVDTPVFGRRERDVRRGFTFPPTIGLRTLVDGALHPGWTYAFVRGEPIRLADLVGSAIADGASPVHLSDFVNAQFDQALTWADVDWLRSVWDGPIVLKGVQTVTDALVAVERGVTASRSPTTAGGSSTARRPHSRSSRRSSTRSGVALR